MQQSRSHASPLRTYDVFESTSPKGDEPAIEIRSSYGYYDHGSDTFRLSHYNQRGDLDFDGYKHMSVG